MRRTPSDEGRAALQRNEMTAKRNAPQKLIFSTNLSSWWKNDVIKNMKFCVIGNFGKFTSNKTLNILKNKGLFRIQQKLFVWALK